MAAERIHGMAFPTAPVSDQVSTHTHDHHTMNAPALLSFGLLSLSATAQDPPAPVREDRGSTAAIGVQFGAPLGRFSEACNSAFIGYGVQLAFAHDKLPFDVGVGFGRELMSRKSFKIPVDIEYLQDHTGTLLLRNNVTTLLPFVRYRPLTGAWQPYVDVFGGANLFHSRSHVNVSSLDDPILRDHVHTDIGTSWGWASGLMVRISDELMLEARFERGYGGRATFVDPASCAVDNSGRLLYGTNTSITQSWRCRLALVVSL